jgi:exopolysaccharide biosynthesis polyprenyl glycosylphosphotransferase
MLTCRSDTARHVHLVIELGLVPVAFAAAAATIRLLGKDLFLLADLWGILRFPLLLTLMAYALVLAGDRRLYRQISGLNGRLLRQLSMACLKGGGLALALLFLFGELNLGRTTYLLVVAYVFVLLLLERIGLDAWHRMRRRRGYGTQQVLVVGTGRSAQRFADDVLAHPEWGVRVLGFLDWPSRTMQSAAGLTRTSRAQKAVDHEADLSPQGPIGAPSKLRLWRYRDIPRLGSVNDLADVVLNNQVDCVTFAVSPCELGKVTGPLRVCDETGTPALLVAEFLKPTRAHTRFADFSGTPAFYVAPGPMRDHRILIKDLFDRLAALAGLIMVLPIMLAAALAIKLDDGGPILFRQRRCGLHGRRFWFYKFRSMVPEAEALKADLMKYNEVEGAAFKMADDPRITRVGKWLRKSSIDELPQLWNVLCGHMSLVGPRPPLPDEVKRFDRWQRRKLSMKPGITCLWQVGGRSNVDFEDWMRMDLRYIDEWSLGLDAKILIDTIPAVFTGHGAR